MWGERVRNKAAGTSIRDALKPRQLPLPGRLLYVSCQGKMQHLEQCARACRWEQGEEVTRFDGQVIATDKGRFWHSASLSEKAIFPVPSF